VIAGERRAIAHGAQQLEARLPLSESGSRFVEHAVIRSLEGH
jgi:hypothetical protein